MNVLIVGSKGFIGSHLVSFYRAKGFDVYGCDVVVDYNDEKYFLVEATNASYEEIFSHQRYDCCINASGASSVPDSFAHPLRDFHLNTSNVFVLLEAIKKYQPACKFLNLSSAAVYGNPPSLPVGEASVTSPMSPYGWHKHYSESVCLEFHRYFGLRTSCARIFSAFGPGLRKQIFWDWAQKAKGSGHLNVFGTGKESRDFIFIDDIVLALDCIVRSDMFNGDVVNVANGREVLIEDALKIFIAEYNPGITFSFNNHVRVGDPLNWMADISRLRSIGYQQTVSFGEGLSKHVKWLKNEI